MKLTFIVFCLFSALFTLNAQVPSISSFSPVSGPVGTVVTIDGSNFSMVAVNIVRFGAVQAAADAVSTTQLTVTVPVGAAYQPVSVTNTATGLTAYSQNSFMLLFPAPPVIDSSAFAAKVDFATAASAWPNSIAIGDIDGDGKPDMAITNYNTNKLSLYRNISTPGSINVASFDTRIDFNTGSGPYNVVIGDVDSDGKADLVVSNWLGNSVSVLRNISTPGSLTLGSLATKIDFVTGTNPSYVALGDLNKDGKPDLAIANYSSNTISVLQNKGSAGIINSGSFKNKVDFAAGTGPRYIAIGDIDQDGRPELAFTVSGNKVSVLRNTSIPDSIYAASFAAKVDFVAGPTPYGLAFGDADGDGKPDIAVANGSGSSASLFRNKSSLGVIDSSSFEAKFDFPVGTSPQNLVFEDLNGDGKPDLAVENANGNSISVLRNTGVPGVINASTFTAKVNFPTGIGPYSLALGDLDLDGKPDMVTVNATANSLSVLRNTLTAAVTPMLTTIPVSAINSTNATSGGDVLPVGGPPVTGRGVCWDISPNPTIAGSKTVDGTGTGIFSSFISGLLPGTTYYARAWATSIAGTGYGNEIIFTTAPIIPNATIKKALIAPVIDGLVDPVWVNANVYNIDQPFGIETPTLGAAGTTTWKGLWTNEGIYLLLQVNDDVFSPAYAGTSPSTWWMYDNPEIYFDVNPVLADGLGAANNLGHYQVAPLFVNGQIDGTPVIDPYGIINSFRVTDPTYVAEYYIPFTKLLDKDGIEVSKTATIGFDITLDDNDVVTPIRNRAVWSNTGTINESWSNMDGCGTFTLEPAPALPVTDIDGNIYNTVNIGTQLWMAENLKTTRYDNGDLIGTTIPDTLDVSGELTPKYQWAFKGNESNVPLYGRLYTWNAITDNRNICPASWHIPSDAEWTVLNDYLGGAAVAGGKLKETGTSHWFPPNTGATNETGFTALPAGIRSITGIFTYDAGYGGWWSSTEIATTSAWYRYVLFNNDSLKRDNYCLKVNGFSVRCVKDFIVAVSLPVILTQNIFNVTSNSATAGSLITSDGGGVISARGVCWSESSNPTTANSFTIDGVNTGGFPSSLAGLLPNTLYYVRSYATNSAGTAYGNEITFTTSIATPTITDIDGNIYNTVVIGTQTWMAENLKTTKYRNGDIIGTTVSPSFNFQSEATPKYQWASNGYDSLVSVFGRLYTWNTITDNRYVCPANWHIPGESEWNVLIGYLGGQHLAGGKLKETSTFHWNSPNTGATNETGFTSVPGGTHLPDGSFNSFGIFGVNWSSTEDSLNYTNAFSFSTSFDNTGLYKNSHNENIGFSARCVMDSQTGISLPTVSTTIPYSIGQHASTSGGNITYDGGGTAILACGVCWSMTSNPTIADSKTNDGSGTGTFTSYLTGLNSGTTYYLRAYATNSAGTDYGEERSFTTQIPVTAVIRKASIAPVIDGVIDTVWANANSYNIDKPVGLETPTLGASGTTTWKSLWTNDGIYILLQVNDNVFVPAYAGTVPWTPWFYDRPEIYLDVNPVLADGIGASSGSGHYQVSPLFIAGQIDGTPFTNFDGVINSFFVTNPSYIGEYFIPFTKLTDINGFEINKAGTIGFDITVTDNDVVAPLRNRAVWANTGSVDESWYNMDDCGTFTLEGFVAGTMVTGITVTGTGGLSIIDTDNGNLQMIADVVPADASNKLVSWSVVNGTGKAFISPDGILTAQTNGTVIVNAKSRDGSYIMSTSEITLSNQVVTEPEAAAMVFSIMGNAFYLADGMTIANWNYDIDLSYTGTVGNVSSYKLFKLELLTNGEFKIRKDHQWLESYGFDEVTIIGDTANFVRATPNIKVLNGKMYELTFMADWVTNTFTISLDQPFSGGSGTAGDPFIIADATDLNNIRNFCGIENRGVYFLQTASIDLGISPWNLNEGWDPIGNVSSQFYANYNGNGFTINNLTINRPVGVYTGLFGWVKESSLTNIGLVNVNITGDQRVGALVGKIQDNGFISDCYSTGNIIGQEWVAGLAGNLYLGSSMQNSYSSVDVEMIPGASINSQAGGLIARTYMNISVNNCFATGNVYGVGSAKGALVGLHTNNGTFNNCYATGDVYGDNQLGGFIGGFTQGNVSNCYSVGRVTGTSNTGGLFGTFDISTASVVSSYWNKETSGLNISAAGSPKNTLQMISSVSYAGWGFGGVPWNINNGSGYPYLQWQNTPGTFNLPPAFIPPSNLLAAPGNAAMSLSWQAPSIGSPTGYKIYRDSIYIGTTASTNFIDAGLTNYILYRYSVSSLYSANESGTVNFPVVFSHSGFSGGDGTWSNPFLISNAGELFTARMYLTSYFRQVANIDLGISLWSSGEGWKPVGLPGIPFAGNYDGNGFTIKNLMINNPDINNAGLFGQINGASITNVIIENVNISGQTAVGGLSGEAFNTNISNISVTGSISGFSFVGGIVGSTNSLNIVNAHSSGNINATGNYAGGLTGDHYLCNTTKSYSSMNVSSTGDFIGGLFGSNQWTSNVSESYFTGSVSGNKFVGGITGIVDSSNIISSYSTGNVAGNLSTGGVTGAIIKSGNVTDTYWNTETSGQAASAVGLGRTTDNMTYPYDVSTFNTWNFAGVWADDAGYVINNGYPFLRSQVVPGTASSSSTICSGTSATLTLTGSAGAIQWQESPDGSTNWINVIDGAGGNSTSYITGNLASTTYFRAALTQPGFSAVFSNVIMVTVNPIPGTPGTIIGATTVCQRQNLVTYKVGILSDAISYVWTLPTGASGSSLVDSIIVDYGTSSVSGNITVNGNNLCGDGVISSLSITVIPLPADAGLIAGSTTVCQGQNLVTYSVPPIANATSYEWILPSGAIGASISNSIVVDYGGSAVSGNLSVSGTSSCGNGVSSMISIVVNEKPVTPVVTFDGKILHSDVLNGNQWYNQNGLINDAINQDYNVTADGDYYDVVTLSGCSSENSNVISRLSQCEARFEYSWNNLTGFTSFTDLSGGDPTGWSWSFGDGTYSKLQNPVHNYVKDGVYTVTQNILNESTGCISSVTKEVIAISVITCEADFEISINSTTGLAVFTSRSVNATDYYWDFGDGDFNTDSIAEHTYTKPGIYPVCLNIWNDANGCQAISCKNLIYIPEGEQYIDADFTTFTNTTDNSVIFSDLSSSNTTDWYWTMGDGKVKTDQNPVYTYAKAGLYNICLTVFDDNNLLSNSVCKQIRVGTIPCDLASDYTYFINPVTLEVVFFSLSQGSVDNYFWDFGDGSTAAIESPSHQYLTPGYYEVELSVRNSLNNCVDEYSQFIQVGSVDCRAGFTFRVNPGDYTVNFTDDSKGQINYYYWDFGDGTSSIEQNPDQLYKDQGIYMVGQFVIDNSSCIDYILQPVQVGIVDCSADFVSYIDSSRYTAYFTNRNLGMSTALLWSFGDGSFSTFDNPVHEFPGAGIYSAGLNTFDFNTGCMDYYEENMMIGSMGIDCSADFIYRADPANGEVTFINKSIGDIGSFMWNFGEIDAVNSTEPDPVYTYTKGGYYNVCLTVTNSDGIRNMGCKWLLIEGSPENDCRANFMFTVDSSSLTATFADNSFGDINKYTWDFGDSKADSISIDQNPTHIFNRKGFYLVQLKVENTATGCVSNEYKLLNIADNQVLKAAFGYEAKVPDKKFAGYPVDLVSASSGDGATVEWDFGDKQIKKGSFTVMDSTSRNVTHYYEKPGRYEVCLRISDPIRNISDMYCSYVYTKNAVNVNEIDESGINLRVYPNPFIDFTTISYSVAIPGFIEIAIYDQLGRKLETLVKSNSDSGDFQINWKTKSVTAGVYHLKMITKTGIITLQLVITR